VLIIGTILNFSDTRQVRGKPVLLNRRRLNIGIGRMSNDQTIGAVIIIGYIIAMGAERQAAGTCMGSGMWQGEGSNCPQPPKF